jgi:hypothetical protein
MASDAEQKLLARLADVRQGFEKLAHDLHIEA